MHFWAALRRALPIGRCSAGCHAAQSSDPGVSHAKARLQAGASCHNQRLYACITAQGPHQQVGDLVHLGQLQQSLLPDDGLVQQHMAQHAAQRIARLRILGSHLAGIQ